jgi:Domain of unknown function (DUF4124)
MNTLHSSNLHTRYVNTTRWATFEGRLLPKRLQTKIMCLGLLMLVSTLASGADIQKCVDAQGKVSYTDKPCQGAEKSVSSRPAPAPKVIRTASEPMQPAPALSNDLRKLCEADRLAMREKTVPIADLEKLKIRIAACAHLEIQEAIAAHDAAEASESQAEFTRKSPACQAQFTELSDLQSTMEASEEIEHYIALQRVYERTCPSD